MAQMADMCSAIAGQDTRVVHDSARQLFAGQLNRVVLASRSVF